MDPICPQPPEQLQERMQAMAAAIKQEEAAQVDALHRQRALEKRLQEISKVRDCCLCRGARTQSRACRTTCENASSGAEMASQSQSLHWLSCMRGSSGKKGRCGG